MFFKIKSINYLLLLPLNMIFLLGFTQEPLKDSIPKIKLTGYLESYYIYDFSNPNDHNRPDFFYSFNRHNEFNLNLGYIKLNYQEQRVKANLALMAGTYSEANLAHEPIALRNILEANVSYQLLNNKQTWLTVGVFSSHLGFESATGADCWNLTRSILAENSPYYLAGLKLYNTTKNNKWTYGITLANGWQRISRIEGNQVLGLGHQITYTPKDDFIINSSSYIGSEFPDSTLRMRYFHDFYAIINTTRKLSFIAGIDVGIEQKDKNSSDYSSWLAPILISKYTFNDKLSLAGRLEYYNDKDEVIITTIDNEGFSTLGYSLNIDVKLTEKLLLRFEGRSLRDARNIYGNNNNLTNANTFVGTSLSIKL